MSKHSNNSLFTFQSLEKLLPKSFFHEMSADIGSDGELRGKGSVFSTLLKEGKSNYPCCYTHENNCWNFSLEKLDVCSPKMAKTYLVIHMIPFLIYKRKQLRKAPI